MAPTRASDPKPQILREQGVLHPHAEGVTDPLFQDSEFFDPRDLVQVKYEMLRRVEHDGQPVARTTAAFGLSRPTFYQAQAAFSQQGLGGLLPRKRGPRGAHKLTDEILGFLQATLAEDPSLRASALVRLVHERFGLHIHPRTIERRLAWREKKRHRGGGRRSADDAGDGSSL